MLRGLSAAQHSTKRACQPEMVEKYDLKRRVIAFGKNVARPVRKSRPARPNKNIRKQRCSSYAIRMFIAARSTFSNMSGLVCTYGIPRLVNLS